MKFVSVLIAVKDMEKSLAFYQEIFGQEITMDLGANITLSGGFTLQDNFGALVGFDKKTIKKKSHNMELYFEVDDFDDFINKLKSFQDIQYVHEPKTYSWHQRVVRIYDPDFHIIEVEESMGFAVKRLLNQGDSLAETAEKTKMPLPFILACKEGLI